MYTHARQNLLQSPFTVTHETIFVYKNIKELVMKIDITFLYTAHPSLNTDAVIVFHQVLENQYES